MYGTVLAEVGDTVNATAALKKAIGMCPDEGHEKYMYLSQLVEGDEAIGYSKKGIEVLRKAVLEEADPVSREELGGQLCQAICSLVETMLSSKGADAIAEEATSLLLEAGKHQPQSPEPLQVLASLRVEQGKVEEARQALGKSLEFWLRRGVGEGEDGMDVDDDDLADASSQPPPLPSFEFRFETAKLIMELEESAEKAIDILDSLLEENDANLDVWFLLTLAHQGMGQLEEAAGCLDHIEQALSSFPEDSIEKQNLNTLRSDLDRIKQEMQEQTK